MVFVFDYRLLFGVSLVFAIGAEGRFGGRGTDGRFHADSLTQDNFAEFVNSSKNTLVDFYDPRSDKFAAEQAELDAAAQRTHAAGSTVPVGKVDILKEPDLARMYVPSGNFPQLQWFVHGQPTQYHRQLRKRKDIFDFVVALDRPSIVDVKSEEEAKEYDPTFLAQVPKKSSTYHVLEVMASRHMDRLAVTHQESTNNKLVWFSNRSAPKVYDGEITVEAMDKWVRKQLSAKLRSEDVPEGFAVDEGSHIIVGRTFEDIVVDNDKDVMLMVYAAWCGFCRKFHPTWNKFALMVADHNHHLMVAKLDGDLNDSPVPEEFVWDHYPKIFYKRAGIRSPFVFKGNRSFEGLVNFANEHGMQPLKFSEGPDSISDL